MEKNDKRNVLMVNDNKDLNKGKLSIGLNDFKMKDLVKERTVKKGPSTYFRGKIILMVFCTDLVYKIHQLSCKKMYPTIGEHRRSHRFCGRYYKRVLDLRTN